MRKTVLSLFLLVLYCNDFSHGFFDWRSSDRVEDTAFSLFTRSNSRGEGILVPMGDVNQLLASGFKGSLPTKFVAHGHNDNARSKWVNKMKDALLMEEEMNVFLIDWSWCAKKILYEPSVVCARDVGEYLGDFLVFLQTEGNADIDKVHLIGHSLGAQLLAFAANVFPQEKTIGRISGLDPAGLLYEHANETDRLNPSRAKVVDIIHTCRVIAGIGKPIGTIDLYPNGGYFQPGCEPLDLGCQHGTSHQYFQKTIKKRDLYIGRKCETYDDAIKGTCFGEQGIMGYDADKSPPGIYYINVTSPPF